jgi:hypothetical protein
MAARTRVVGLAALIGFLACTAWSAQMAPSACCTASCEPCPIVICKSTAATTSPKVDSPLALVPATLDQLFGHAEPALALTAHFQIPAFLPHEFRRPMRN